MTIKRDEREKKLTGIAKAKKQIQASLSVPAAAPFCIDAAAKSAKRRKRVITQRDIGRMAAIACGAGRWNNF